MVQYCILNIANTRKKLIHLGDKMDCKFEVCVKKSRKGFTLAELLIVVILGVLVAISVPIFTSQLEKSREAVDMANIRSAYAQVMTEAITDGLDHDSDAIKLKQKKDDWQNTAGKEALHSIASKVIGKPAAEGKAWVEYRADSGQVILSYEVPVPGDKATLDALNFPEGSKERKILSSLADAERKALQLYAEENTTKVIGYLVKLNADGTFTLEKKLDTQSFHESSPNAIVNNGYMIAVMDGKVGSNLSFDASNNTLTGKKYHILNNTWNSYAENIDFNY